LELGEMRVRRIQNQHSFGAKCKAQLLVSYTHTHTPLLVSSLSITIQRRRIWPEKRQAIARCCRLRHHQRDPNRVSALPSPPT
jgi:hypothetical protein